MDRRPTFALAAASLLLASCDHGDGDGRRTSCCSTGVLVTHWHADADFDDADFDDDDFDDDDFVSLHFPPAEAAFLVADGPESRACDSTGLEAMRVTVTDDPIDIDSAGARGGATAR